MGLRQGHPQTSFSCVSASPRSYHSVHLQKQRLRGLLSRLLQTLRHPSIPRPPASSARTPPSAPAASSPGVRSATPRSPAVAAPSPDASRTPGCSRTAAAAPRAISGLCDESSRTRPQRRRQQVLVEPPQCLQSLARLSLTSPHVTHRLRVRRHAATQQKLQQRAELLKRLSQRRRDATSAQKRLLRQLPSKRPPPSPASAGDSAASTAAAAASGARPPSLPGCRAATAAASAAASAASRRVPACQTPLTTHHAEEEEFCTQQIRDGVLDAQCHSLVDDEQHGGRQREGLQESVQVRQRGEERGRRDLRAQQRAEKVSGVEIKLLLLEAAGERATMTTV